MRRSPSGCRRRSSTSPYLPYTALLVIVLVALVVTAGTRNLPDVLLVVAFAVLGASAVRNVAPAAIVLGMVGARYVDLAVRRMASDSRCRWSRGPGRRCHGSCLPHRGLCGRTRTDPGTQRTSVHTRSASTDHHLTPRRPRPSVARSHAVGLVRRRRWPVERSTCASPWTLAWNSSRTTRSPRQDSFLWRHGDGRTRSTSGAPPTWWFRQTLLLPRRSRTTLTGNGAHRIPSAMRQAPRRCGSRALLRETPANLAPRSARSDESHPVGLGHGLGGSLDMQLRVHAGEVVLHRLR